MSSLLAECSKCGGIYYLLIDDNLSIKRTICKKCNNICIVKEDKLPTVQEKIEYNYNTMLRLITDLLQKGVSTIVLSYIADRLWPTLEWHTRRLDKNTVWAFQRKK